MSAVLEEQCRAEQQALAQLESIREMVEELDTEEGQETIQKDPLSVLIRSGWYTPGQEPEAVEYKILLCTGGPAVRIIGELGLFAEPASASIQYQDWFTPWKDYPVSTEDEETLLEYARCFYYGD